ncbi:MAG: GGDEF domain-containing protein [Treponema sp.]|nr:GGDEF domain-containing protein [Treponema sp.]
MVFSVKNRSALLDDEIHVVSADTTKDFFTYFDYTCFDIVEYVHPDERERFIDLVMGKYDKTDERSDVFHLLRNTGEYRYNFVTVRNVPPPHLARIRLFDIYDAIEFVRASVEQNDKMRAALSLTNEYLFSYQKSDGVFTITHYNQGQEVVLCRAKFDKWKEQSLADGTIAKESLEQLNFLQEDFSLFPHSFSRKIESSLRTGGAMMERLRFLGTRHNGLEDSYMVGRILTDESFRQLHLAHNLLDELQLDTLTQVYNKKTITEYAQRKIKAHLSDMFALVIIDLDHFKPVNDQYGHLAGDKVLARAAARFKDVVGEDGVVGRFGGDEFMLILDNIGNVHILRGMLRALITQIRKEFEGDFEGISITCSIGTAVYPTNGTTYDELFRKADFCLYRAKDKGRDRYVFFRDDLHAQAYAEFQNANNEGKKTDGREIVELHYMSDYMSQLAADPQKAIMDIMRHMLGTYATDNISVYSADKDMQCVMSVGMERLEFADAKYALTDMFKDSVGSEGFICCNRMYYGNALCDFLRDRGVVASIQCVIGSIDKPKGLVTFNKFLVQSKWAEYEVNCARLFAGSLALLNLNEL